MALFLDILFLGGGLLLVIFGANGLVDGASSVAKRYKVSNLVIGLTIVAFGTSAPEMSVSVISAINNNTDLCIGNVVGSNLFNILIILGVTAIILPLSVGLSTISKEIPLALLSAVLLWVFANDFLLDGETVPVISRAEGIAFLAFFAIFIYYTFSVAKVYSESDKTEIKELTLLRSVLYVTLGLVALVGGGKLMTDGAVGIAGAMGVSESVIALTIVAAGTSIPELATSITAALKKNADMAIGNVVGSNIFNVFFVLGVSATIRPLPIGNITNADMLLNIVAGLLLFLFYFTFRRKKIDRVEGIIFIAMYMGYIVYLIL